MAQVVELQYVNEPAYETDQMAATEDVASVKVAGPVYIPMFIPSGPRNIPPNLTPTKAAPIRCVNQLAGLRPDKTAISVADTQDNARNAGLLTR